LGGKLVADRLPLRTSGLQTVFGGKKQASMLELAKLVSQNLT